jgi:hypothetical protein
MQPLIIYTLRPEGRLAQQFARFLGAANHVVQMRPLSELPPVNWVKRQREKLAAEQAELHQSIVTLEMGVALATAAPHRFPDGARWAAQKHTYERRLKVVEWKLQQLAKEEGGVSNG